MPSVSVAAHSSTVLSLKVTYGKYHMRNKAKVHLVKLLLLLCFLCRDLGDKLMQRRDLGPLLFERFSGTSQEA